MKKELVERNKEREVRIGEIKKDLHSKLWSITSELRGSMSDQDYKDYILGMMFYKKVSETVENRYHEAVKLDVEELIENGIIKNVEDKEVFEIYADMYDMVSEDAMKAAYDVVVDDADVDYDGDDLEIAIILQAAKLELIDTIGIFINPKYWFITLNHLLTVEKSGFDIELLERGINDINESSNEGASMQLFNGIFDNFDLKSNRIGSNVNERQEVVEILITRIADIDFKIGEMDLMGDAYEYLIGKFATNSGAKSGSFYTPYQVGNLIGKLVALEKSDVDIAGDFTGGSGSLLLTLSNYVNVRRYAYQEMVTNTYNIARMNMIMHGKNYEHFQFGNHDLSMYNSDALKQPKFINDKIDVIVSNPPYSQKWCSSPEFLNDERFEGPGKLAPKSYADYAFLLTMYHSLADDGIMAIVLPHGVLFRGGAEGKIREWLIKENAIDTVIGLPEDIFFGTSIPTSIIILRKGREREDVLFIDAKDEFEKAKNKNIMTEKNIDRVVSAYKERKFIDRFSDIATLEDIKENDYNLNIPRYVDTFEPEEDIDVREVQRDIVELKKEIHEIDLELDGYFKELGLPGILGGDSDE